MPFLISFVLKHHTYCSVAHPFLGDYVRLRQNVQWKKMCVATNDQYVVFADIINKVSRTSGKVNSVPTSHANQNMLRSFLLTNHLYSISA